MAQPMTLRVAQSMTVARNAHPSQVGIYVMSPTIFCPGTSAVKSRFTRSGIGPAWPCCVVAGRQAQLPHDPADQLRADGDARAGQLRGDPPVPVSAVGILEHVPDQCVQIS